MPVGARDGDGPGLADAYAAADLVCYPSTWEGFGNALLEAFFHRRPVLVNRYPVYAADIAPAGVRCIELDGGLSPERCRQVRALLADPASWQDAIEANYETCLRHFSYATVRGRVLPLLDRAGRSWRGRQRDSAAGPQRRKPWSVTC